MAWEDLSDDTIAVRRLRRPAPWYLVLDSGRHIEVAGRVIIGRGAAADARWPDALLVHVTDAGKTVSKTHALVEADGDALWFTDLDSTNGMSIARGRTEPVQLVTGERERASAGDRVHLGQFVLLVSREPAF